MIGNSKYFGFIYNPKSLREKRDDRTMDQYEESWFDAEDDEPPNNDAAVADDSSIADQVAPASSNEVGKPLSAQLQDVELLDSVSLKKSMDKTIINNAPTSSTLVNTARMRPNSPENNLISSPTLESKTDSVYTATSKAFNNSKSLVNNRTLMNNRLNKVQIKINSTSLSSSLNQKEGDSPSSMHTNGSLLAVNNGGGGGDNDIAHKSVGEQQPTNHVAEPQPKNNLVRQTSQKLLLICFVIYCLNFNLFFLFSTFFRLSVHICPLPINTSVAELLSFVLSILAR